MGVLGITISFETRKDHEESKKVVIVSVVKATVTGSRRAVIGKFDCKILLRESSLRSVSSGKFDQLRCILFCAKQDQPPAVHAIRGLPARQIAIFVGYIFTLGK